ncbi:MAG: cell division protein FtsI (penicillin-binding protein 3) [Pseudohongiellaceae bacterium]|jgi:cell division protein FtsI (penicillin-binding protein 3)
MLRARRLVLGFAVMMMASLACLSTRLAWIQLVDHRVATARQRRMSVRELDLPARRGALLDRHGRLLSSSVETLRAEVLPRNVLNRRETSGERARLARDIARFLGPVVGRPAEDLAKRLTADKWSILGDPVQDPDSIAALESEARKLLYGVDLISGWARRAPWGAIAGNLLGYVSHEGHGVSGLEQGLDGWLSGVDGKAEVRVDQKGRHVADATIVREPPLPGLDITLTLDATIQKIVEEECLAAYFAHEASSTMAVVLDVASGDVLAMVSVPGLNADDSGDRPKEGSLIRPAQMIYAPGSTLKPLMMAGALQLGLVRDGDTIDTARDQGRFGRRRVRDVHPVEGWQTLREIIINSSNIGMAQILTSAVPEDQSKNTALMAPVRDFLLALGFGQPLGFPIPAEAWGIVTPLERWTRNYTMVSVSYGQEIAVTALQMSAALATLADGQYRQPRLVASYADDEGQSTTVPAVLPRRVFSAAIAASVRSWMADSVREGNCSEVKLPGLTVAGKTGTATSEVDLTKETHSFAALVPAEDPAIALVLVVHEPNGVRYSSQSAAPAAGRILRRLMPYLGYPVE